MMSNVQGIEFETIYPCDDTLLLTEFRVKLY
jgi:hypothetical protein